MLRITLILSALLLTLPTLAKDYCENPMSGWELRQCASDEYKKADRELNEVWIGFRNCRADAVANGYMEKGVSDAIVKAQKAWIKFKEAECALEASLGAHGGALWPVINLGCLAGMTEKRTEFLEAQYKQLRDVNACPSGEGLPEY